MVEVASNAKVGTLRWEGSERQLGSLDPLKIDLEDIDCILVRSKDVISVVDQSGACLSEAKRRVTSC
jgi:hypothetical protein